MNCEITVQMRIKDINMTDSQEAKYNLFDAACAKLVKRGGQVRVNFGGTKMHGTPEYKLT